MAYRILVADDETEIRDVLRLYLEKEGYEVVEAADGPEALRLLKQEKIDLAILDIMMPGLDGFELCREIRSRVDCPIIFLTAKIQEADIEQPPCAHAFGQGQRFR